MIKKIVYLFGAGATHAEILNLLDGQPEEVIEKNGLLISHVSQRVMGKAQSIPGFKNGVEFVTSPEGRINIELLISLLEANQVNGGATKVKKLKSLVQRDIVSKLSETRRGRFFLHRALLELHSLIEQKEELLGIISLNYDQILDDAYRQQFGVSPNYNHTSEKGNEIPLLKLHGSFNWKRLNNYGKKHDVEIIPLGINKNYLIPPYNFIWGKAFDILTKCDILRVIGCSLSQNDLGLVDLLFKAHLEKGAPLEIQIINRDHTAREIKNNYGFFPNIILPLKIEETLIADTNGLESNPFKTWLKAKGDRMLKEKVTETKFIKKCFDL